jgi:hypothetical protein
MFPYMPLFKEGLDLEVLSTVISNYAEAILMWVVVMYQGGEILYNILVEIQSSNKLVFWG